MPAYYSSIEEEHKAVRERAGMIDLSLMGRFDIKGRQAQNLIQRLAVNDAAKLADGQIMYTTFCSEIGNIVDDVTVWRFNSEHFRVITSSVMRQRSLSWIQHNNSDLNSYVTDISPALGCIAVQGPISRTLLQKLSDADLNKLGFFRFVQTRFDEIPVTIARVGFTGELGYECYTWSEDTVQTWNTIADAGKDLGLKPYGLDVLDTLRFEKGFIFFGYEVTEKNNPYECGLDRWIRFDKADFNGKEALLKISKEGPRQKLVGLVLEGEKPASASLPIKSDGRRIGSILLAFYALSARENMAWAFVDAEEATPGRQVKVGEDGNDIVAKLVDIRYYDPKGERMRL